MSVIPNAQLTHVGVYVADLDRMVGFYTKILGLAVTDRGTTWAGVPIAFLSRSPDEHHQLVLALGRNLDTPPQINQISFRVGSLEDLRAFYSHLLRAEVTPQRTVTHGNAWSIYFLDPEGNKVEIYTPSSWYVNQPFGVHVDFTDSAAALMRHTEELVRADPGHMTREDWEQSLRVKLESEGDSDE